MKKLSRKLNLNRETLIPLTDDSLDGINGGFTPMTGTLTSGSMPSRSQASMCRPEPSSIGNTRFFCATSQQSLPK